MNKCVLPVWIFPLWSSPDRVAFPAQPPFFIMWACEPRLRCTRTLITRNSHHPFSPSTTDPKWTQDCSHKSPVICLQPLDSKAIVTGCWNEETQGWWHPFVVAAEVVYFLFLLYYMVMQVRDGLVAPWARDGDGGVPVPSPTISLFPREGPKEGEGKAALATLWGPVYWSWGLRSGTSEELRTQRVVLSRCGKEGNKAPVSAELRLSRNAGGRVYPHLGVLWI